MTVALRPVAVSEYGADSFLVADGIETGVQVVADGGASAVSRARGDGAGGGEMMRFLVLPLLFLAAPLLPMKPGQPRPAAPGGIGTGGRRRHSAAGLHRHDRGRSDQHPGLSDAGAGGQLPVAAGDRVARGDVLATLDQVTLQEDVEAAQAALAGARAEAALAQQTLARTEELVRRGVRSEAQLESAQGARDSAVAQLASAEADLERAQDAAGFGVLAAPIDGIVLSTAVEPGSVVSPAPRC